MTEPARNGTSTDPGAGPGPRVRVFGGIAVDDTDGAVHLGGPKQRRLLALLVIRAGSVVTLDWLSEHLWDDEERPDPTVAALRTYVSRLRRSLPTEARQWIQTEPAGYRFVAPDDRLEHRQFAALRARATRARELDDPFTAQRLLEEALSLWQGEPFGELEDLHWARADIEQLRIDRMEMMEERWEAVLSLGRHTQVTGELAAFTAEHRLRERAARQHALALHRSGRTAEALRVIDEHRRALADESGLDPSPEIVELEQALLAGDDSLMVATTGRPLRGYRLLEEIGAGAFSIVWRGIQPSVNRDVAIKQIRAELASRPDFIRRFEAEAQLVARIEHPHIVPMIDFWRDPDSAYLVMRWLRGGTLEQRLAEGPLTVAATVTLARQVGGALAAAHGRGVVHRDVKAANILFDEQGNAFLSDFGIALTLAEPGGPDEARSHGSPAYAAPEQIRREPLSPRSDIFSLGVVLHECLTGSLPFGDSSSIDELLERQLHAPIPPVSDWRGDVPPAVTEAVRRATAKEPAERYASIDDFLAALDADTPEPGPAIRPSRPVDNPYKGLRSFDDGDGERFFGRERLTAEMVDRLAAGGVQSRCIVVVGPSGSGKSSVVRAGLLPAVRGDAVAGSADWFTTVMVPGVDPYESLEGALLRIAVDPPPSLGDELRSGDSGVLSALRQCLGSDTQKVLLVIDQLEEVFTECTGEDAVGFLEALTVAVEDPTSPLRLVATLRADYYHRPLEHPSFARVLRETAIDVTPLGGDELEQAIVEPAARLGIGFESGLVATIAADTLGQPSPLPLLQYMLSELFDRRTGGEMTASAYDDVGGLGGAITTHAERLHTEADERQRAAMRRVFGRLTNPDEQSTDLRRRVPVVDLGDDTAIAWVLDRFGAARLLTFDRDDATREPTVEVAHEALLREWPRLVSWLREDLDLLRATEAVRAAAGEWAAGGRDPSDLLRGVRLDAAVELRATAPDRLRELDREFVGASQATAEAEKEAERRRVRRLRRLVAGAGLALVAALAASGLAVRQQQRADDEAARAQRSAAEAERQAELAAEQAALAEEQTAAAVAAAEESEVATLISRSAALTAEDPTISILLALEAHRRRPGPETEQAVLSALGTGNVATRQSSISVPPPGECDGRRVSADRFVGFGLLDGELLSGSLETGEFVPRAAAPAPCVSWMGDEDADRRWAQTLDGRRMWLGPFTGEWDVERTFEQPTYVVSDAFTPEHRHVVRMDNPGATAIGLLDDRTGALTDGPIVIDGELTHAELRDDGRMAAVGFAVAGRPEERGHTIVLDAVSGQPLYEFDTAFEVTTMTWHPETAELIAVTADGQVLTIDPLREEVVSTVRSTATSSLLDVAVRPDGFVTVVSRGQVEVLDGRNGAIRPPTGLRNAAEAWARSDGAVVTLTADSRLEVFDLDGIPLALQVQEVDPFASFAFDAGRAAGIRALGGIIEVVDLDDDTRWNPRLVTATGEPFEAVKVHAEPDGLWAITADMTVARFAGDELVEQFDLGGTGLTGTRFGDHWALLSEQPTGRVVDLMSLERGATGPVVRIDAPDAATAHPSLDGGVHIVTDRGVRTYDREGELVHEVDGPARVLDQPSGLITLDPATGRLALAVASGVLLVDPLSGEFDVLPVSDAVVNLGFARNGELLVITGADGTVRLWDLHRGASAGVVYSGTGAVPGSPSWYDDATDTVWVNSSGKLLQITLDPARWLDLACVSAGRNLTQEEWDRYVPGDELLWFSCLDQVRPS